MKKALLLFAFLCSNAVAQPVENLVNVNFKTDVRVFSVMAALNAAGFDYETPEKEMSEVRKAVRGAVQLIEQTDPILYGQMKSFYDGHRTSTDESKEQVLYTSLALLLSGPPEFQLNVDQKNLPEDAWKILGFEKLVRELHQKAKLQALWQEHHAQYEAELAVYRPLLKQVIQDTLRYFRTPPRIVLDREIIFIPDLLNAKNIVNARNLERVYYLIVGPTDNPADNHIQLQHEYLHFLLDPLVEKYAGTLLRHQELLNLAQNQPNIKSEYQNKFLLMTTESLIESMLLRLHPPENLEKEMVRLFREGLIFAPLFHRGLQSYESNDLLSFPAYCEALFQEISEEKVKADEKSVAAIEDRDQAEKRAKASAERKVVEEISRTNRINSLLREAGVLLADKQFDRAEQKLAQLLKEDPEHGSALFYTAQIAAQKKDHDRAFEFYGRSAQSPSTPGWVRAWALLRVGNFHAHRGEFEKARNCFQQILATEGDLKGARAEAEQSLQHLPQGKK